MLVVKVELHSAITGQVSTLGSMIISNDGKSFSKTHGNYDVKVAHKSRMKTFMGIWKNPLRKARVENHYRDSNVWLLVKKAINASFNKKGE